MAKSYHGAFLDTAGRWAEESYCRNAKVGAVLVRGNRPISVGYNGTAQGTDNCCEDCHGKTKSDVIHAEMNAILFAASEGIATRDAELYVTLSPCSDCAKHVLQAKIRAVYYREEYRDLSGVEYLRANGVTVEKIT